MSASRVFGQTLLLANALVLEAALAYPGTTTDTSRTYFEAPPDAIRVKIVTSGGDYTAGKTVTGTLQTSPDSTNWVTTGLTTGALNADGVAEINVNVPVLKYIRVEFTGTATATIAVHVFSDLPTGALSDGTIAQQDRGSSNGVAWCGCAVILDTPIVFAGASQAGTSKQLPGPTATCGYVKVVISARTVGTVTPKLQWSPDLVTWYDSGDDLGTLNANGTTLLKLTKGLSGYIRLYYTVAAAFDGTVTSTIYTDGSWS